MLVKDKLDKLKTFDLSDFIGKSNFDEDGTQNYLVFQPMYRYFKLITNNHHLFYHGNLKDYLMKILVLLLLVFLHQLIIMVTK